MILILPFVQLTYKILLSVVGARLRYEFMINKYTALQSNNFMVGSGGTKYVPAFGNPHAYQDSVRNNSIYLLALVGFSELSILAYTLIIKKKVTK